VTLSPGTHLMAGSAAHIYVAPCGVPELPVDDFIVSRPREIIEIAEEPPLPAYDPVAGLLQIFPNPLSNEATIRFELPEPTAVTIAVFNTTGREMLRLANNQERPAGYQEFRLDGTRLPDGLYYVVLQAGKTMDTARVMVLRR